MNIEVDPEWWKKIFDEVYLITDARSVCNDDITRREVDLICELLPVETDHKILDLCGGHGRHSFELCSRGFCRCTLLDYSQYLIECAKKRADECDYTLDIVRADARHTGLRENSYDHVIIMGNSLGYISKPDADFQILEEANRVLWHGGWILIDVVDGNAMRQSFSPSAWHEIGKDIVVCRFRRMVKNTVYVREMVLSKNKGLIRDQGYSIRYYEPATLTFLLKKAGFICVEVKTGICPHGKEGDYGFMSNRMIATGKAH